MQNSTKRIIVEHDKEITTLKINREQALNAFDWESLSELDDIFRDFSRDQSQKVMIITGVGDKSFCVGADLKDFKMMDSEQIVQWCMLGSNIFNNIAKAAKPVIAAINGYALGGGLELALACDFRIGSEKVILGLPEVTLGWIPGWGGVKRLTQIVGYEKARYLLMLGERIKADEALNLGLLSKVVSSVDLMAEAIELARQLCEKDPRSLAIIKMMLHDQNGPVNITESLLEAMSVGLLGKSSYALEKIKSFASRGKKK
jgi:enoyl-CoA hydratase/carnithine racemase